MTFQIKVLTWDMLVIVSVLLRITATDYPFGIFKHFILYYCQHEEYSVYNMTRARYRKTVGYVWVFGFINVKGKIRYLAGDLVLQQVINNYSLQVIYHQMLMQVNMGLLERTNLRLVDGASCVQSQCTPFRVFLTRIQTTLSMLNTILIFYHNMFLKLKLE